MTEVVDQCPWHIIDTQGSDSYSFNESKGQGHCLSCGLTTWTDDHGRLWGRHTDSNGRKGKAKLLEGDPTVGFDDDEEEYEVMESNQPEGGKYVPDRGILERTLRFFDVKTFDDQPWVLLDKKTKKVVDKGTSTEVHFVYPTGSIKKRRLDLDKKHGAHFTSVGDMDALFGMNLFPAGCSKKIVVTEGEYDALAAYQMLNSGSYVNPVVSLPGASPSKAFWENCHKYLDSFEQILLSVDDDEAGHKLAAKMADIFPRKVFLMDHFGKKDANDVLRANLVKEYKNQWFNPRRYKPNSILTDGIDYLKLYDDSPDFEYFPTGIPQLDEKILGINKGYLTLIQADTGVGKSEFMRYLEWQCLQNSNYTVAAKHLEESKLRSLLGLVSYQLEENVTLKKYVEEKGLTNQVREAISSITDSERFITFDIDESAGNDDLMDRLNYLVSALGVDYIFLEPIQDAVTGANSSEKEGKLSDLSTRLSNFAADKNVGVVVIAHQNSDGGSMYSSMITKRAAFKIILKGDREAEDPSERNKTQLYVEEKNRVGMGFGYAGTLEFDFDSYMLTPVAPPKAPVVKRNDF